MGPPTGPRYALLQAKYPLPWSESRMIPQQIPYVENTRRGLQILQHLPVR